MARFLYINFHAFVREKLSTHFTSRTTHTESMIYFIPAKVIIASSTLVFSGTFYNIFGNLTNTVVAYINYFDAP